MHSLRGVRLYGLIKAIDPQLKQIHVADGIVWLIVSTSLRSAPSTLGQRPSPIVRRALRIVDVEQPISNQLPADRHELRGRCVSSQPLLNRSQEVMDTLAPAGVYVSVGQKLQHGSAQICHSSLSIRPSARFLALPAANENGPERSDRLAQGPTQASLAYGARGYIRSGSAGPRYFENQCPSQRRRTTGPAPMLAVPVFLCSASKLPARDRCCQRHRRAPRRSHEVAQLARRRALQPRMIFAAGV